MREAIVMVQCDCAFWYAFLQDKDKQNLCCSAQAEMTNSVTKYFHSDGFLNEAIFRQDVQSLLKQPVLNKKSKPL